MHFPLPFRDFSNEKRYPSSVYCITADSCSAPFSPPSKGFPLERIPPKRGHPSWHPLAHHPIRPVSKSHNVPVSFPSPPLQTPKRVWMHPVHPATLLGLPPHSSVRPYRIASLKSFYRAPTTDSTKRACSEKGSLSERTFLKTPLASHASKKPNALFLVKYLFPALINISPVPLVQLGLQSLSSSLLPPPP